MFANPARSCVIQQRLTLLNYAANISADDFRSTKRTLSPVVEKKSPVRGSDQDAPSFLWEMRNCARRSDHVAQLRYQTRNAAPLRSPPDTAPLCESSLARTGDPPRPVEVVARLSRRRGRAAPATTGQPQQRPARSAPA